MARNKTLLNALHDLVSRTYGIVEDATKLEDGQHAKFGIAETSVINNYNKATKLVREARESGQFDAMSDDDQAHSQLASIVIGDIHATTTRDMTFDNRGTFKGRLLFWEAGCERVTEGIIG